MLNIQICAIKRIKTCFTFYEKIELKTFEFESESLNEYQIQEKVNQMIGTNLIAYYIKNNKHFNFLSDHQYFNLKNEILSKEKLKLKIKNNE